MKEIKKIFSILLCLCLVCIIPVPAFAEETEKSGELSIVHVVFNENDYKELPALEKGKQKLLSCGYTQTYVENMDEEIILKIAEADSAEQSVTYYQECLDMEQGEGQFKQIDEETYTEITSRLEAESDRQMQELVSTYRIQDAEGNVIYAPEQMPSTYANTFTSSDGGTLELDNTL